MMWSRSVRGNGTRATGDSHGPGATPVKRVGCVGCALAHSRDREGGNDAPTLDYFLDDAQAVLSVITGR